MYKINICSYKFCLKLAESPNIASLSIHYVGFFMGNHLWRYYHDLIKGSFWICLWFRNPFEVHFLSIHDSLPDSLGIFLWGFIVNYFGAHDHVKRSVLGLFVF